MLVPIGQQRRGSPPGVVWFGLHALGLGPRGLAVTNIALVAVWLAIAYGIARRYRKLSPENAT